MNFEATIKQWIAEDPERMAMLQIAADQGLADWCLAAGFVRNLAWDRLHGHSSATALNDIDLVHFDRNDVTEGRDRQVERDLVRRTVWPWSVKNQARMHTRNFDAPYTSTRNAMSHWVEVETAVGAALDEDGEIVLVSAFGIEPLFDLTVTLNARRPKPVEFRQRVSGKRWLETWPNLVVHA